MTRWICEGCLEKKMACLVKYKPNNQECRFDGRPATWRELTDHEPAEIASWVARHDN